MKDNLKSLKTAPPRLGSLLEKLLPPVEISVYIEAPVMIEFPQVDILLLRRQHDFWTDEQRERLPDGIRDSQASHILLEFKYTESINKDALIQAQMYDFLYRQSQKLTDKDVQTFIISAKQPQPETLTKWGYIGTEYSGVYKSQNPLLITIPLLSLNELSDEPHNAFIKCFASQQKLIPTPEQITEIGKMWKKLLSG